MRVLRAGLPPAAVSLLTCTSSDTVCFWGGAPVGADGMASCSLATLWARVLGAGVGAVVTYQSQTSSSLSVREFVYPLNGHASRAVLCCLPAPQPSRSTGQGLLQVRLCLPLPVSWELTALTLAFSARGGELILKSRMG